MRTIFDGKLISKGDKCFTLFDTNYGIVVSINDYGSLIKDYKDNDTIIVLTHSYGNEYNALMIIKK
jgi:hypothetical protein